MNAIRIHQYGGPEVLTYEEVPQPEPKAGEVLVKVEAVGLNFVEIYRRKGLYSTLLPFVPGEELAGVVASTGPGVTEVKPGDRVVTTNGHGAYATHAITPAARLVSVPQNIDTRQAAAVMLQGMTAHYLSHSTFPLHAGHTALVHAAAGGVGQLLVQLAKWRGARVIGTVSTEEKAQLAREAGADAVILYTREDFEAATKRLTGGQGVDVVYDSVGKDTFDKSLNCLKRRGYMVLYGQSSGPVGPVDPQILNAKGSLFLTRPTLRDYAADRQELLQRTGDLFRWMAEGKLQVHIDRTFSLAEAAEAHRYMEGRQTKGKVLLIP